MCRKVQATRRSASDRETSLRCLGPSQRCARKGLSARHVDGMDIIDSRKFRASEKPAPPLFVVRAYVHPSLAEETSFLDLTSCLLVQRLLLAALF